MRKGIVKHVILSLAVMTFAMLIPVTASAASRSFEKNLGKFGEHETVSTMVVTGSINGTYLKVNSLERYSSAYFWQRGSIGGGDQQVSPGVLCGVGSNTWLGFYTGITLQNGQNVILKSAAYDWLGDTVKGSWYY